MWNAGFLPISSFQKAFLSSREGLALVIRNEVGGAEGFLLSPTSTEEFPSPPEESGEGYHPSFSQGFPFLSSGFPTGAIYYLSSGKVLASCSSAILVTSHLDLSSPRHPYSPSPLSVQVFLGAEGGGAHKTCLSHFPLL